MRRQTRGIWICFLWARISNNDQNLTNIAIPKDKSKLSDVTAQADKLIPTLLQQYEQVLQELEQEQAEIAQIENDDPSYLEELKATIAEQK